MPRKGCQAVKPYADRGWDEYLKGYHGPYRGRIVDAATKKPLAGAVVVAQWSRDRWLLVHSRSEVYALRETTTDIEGRFVLEAEDVECGAPRKTSRPIFVVFNPGYGAFPFNQIVPQGFTGGVFEGLGTTVELPVMADRARQREQVDHLTGTLLSRGTQLPEFNRLIAVERRALGLPAQ